MPKHASSGQNSLYKKALALAKKAHKGQTRSTGEPYIMHPLAVADILKSIHADEETLAAALLHDTVEDTDVTIEDIQRDFGSVVAKMVEGVTKVQKVEYLLDKRERNMQSIRKLFRAMGTDIRVIFIKLADRLHNMQTLGAVSLEKRQRIARETQDIYCPIADLLGIRPWYEELADTCFQELQSADYDQIQRKFKEVDGHQTAVLKKWAGAVKKYLQSAKFKKAEVTLVPRHFAGVFESTRGEEDLLNHIESFYHLRIVIPDTQDAYECLGFVHHLFPPIPHFIDDYIASPRVNGYRALHTTSMSATGNPINIIIQTVSMHEQSQSGLATLYTKNSNRTHSLPDWVETLTSLEQDEQDLHAFFNVVQTEIFGEQCRVSIGGERKKYISVPLHSSMLDVAYYYNPKIAAQLESGTINEQRASIKHVIKDGDSLEFHTSSSATRHPADLYFIHTSLGQKLHIAALSELTKKKQLHLGMKLMAETINIAMDPFFGIKWQKDIRDRIDNEQEVIAGIGTGMLNPFLFLEENSTPEDFFLLDPSCFYKEARPSSTQTMHYVLQTSLAKLRKGDIIGIQVGPDVVDVMSEDVLDKEKIYNKEFLTLTINKQRVENPFRFALRFTFAHDANPLEGIAGLQSLLDTPVKLLQFESTSVTLCFNTDRLRTAQIAYEHLLTLPYVEQIFRITPP